MLVLNQYPNADLIILYHRLSLKLLLMHHFSSITKQFPLMRFILGLSFFYQDRVILFDCKIFVYNSVYVMRSLSITLRKSEIPTLTLLTWQIHMI